MMQRVQMANVSIDHFDPIGVQFAVHLRIKIDNDDAIASPTMDGTRVYIPIEDLMQERTRDPIKSQQHNIFLALELLRRGYGADVFDAQTLLERREPFLEGIAVLNHIRRDNRGQHKDKNDDGKCLVPNMA